MLSPFHGAAVIEICFDFLPGGFRVVDLYLEKFHVLVKGRQLDILDIPLPIRLVLQPLIVRADKSGAQVRVHVERKGAGSRLFLAVGNESGDVQSVGHDATEGPVDHIDPAAAQNAVALEEIAAAQGTGAVLLPGQEEGVCLRQLRVISQAPGAAVDTLPVALEAAVIDRAVPAGVLYLGEGVRTGEGLFMVKAFEVRSVDILHQEPTRALMLHAVQVLRHGETSAVEEVSVERDLPAIGLFSRHRFSRWP